MLTYTTDKTQPTTTKKRESNNCCVNIIYTATTASPVEQANTTLLRSAPNLRLGSGRYSPARANITSQPKATQETMLENSISERSNCTDLISVAQGVKRNKYALNPAKKSIR